MQKEISKRFGEILQNPYRTYLNVSERFGRYRNVSEHIGMYRNISERIGTNRNVWEQIETFWRDFQLLWMNPSGHLTAKHIWLLRFPIFFLVVLCKICTPILVGQKSRSAWAWTVLCPTSEVHIAFFCYWASLYS